jgi:hypothetical protein
MLESTSELHEVRRSVVDLRDGTPATLVELFGDSAARRMVAEGTRRFSHTLDSVIASTDERVREAIPRLADLRFDATSFTLARIAQEPAVEFAATGVGPVSGGILLPLEPIRAPVPAWWAEALEGSPVPSADSLTDRWTRGSLAVEARYDTSVGRATLVVRDTGVLHDWRLASIPTPAHRLYWIDSPADSMIREALARAFDEAALYSDYARTVSQPAAPRHAREHIRVSQRLPSLGRHRTTSLTRYASFIRNPDIP